MPVTFDSDLITPEYLEKFYRDALEAPWHSQGEDYLTDPGNRFRMAAITGELERIGPKSVLDVGCGGMALADFVVDKINADYSGCDLAKPEQIPAGARFAVADAANLPFQDGQFDSVVCSETLEHLYDPAPALKEIARVLTSEGFALITVPNCFSFDSLDGATGLISTPLRLAARVGIATQFINGINVHITRAAPGKWSRIIESNGLIIDSDNPIYLFPYIPYFLKGIKKIEFELFKNMKMFDFWRKMENSLKGKFPAGRLGQFHFFLCRKK